MISFIKFLCFPNSSGYEVEQTIKIDENVPSEVYYYQQISDGDCELFNSPWGGVIIKNFDTDGKLVSFNNISEFETFRKEKRKQMWLYLKLKVFKTNDNDFLGIFCCPECPCMAGFLELGTEQDARSIIGCLCIHSRVASMKIGDWRKEWTVSLSPSNLELHVDHNEASNCVILIPKSSNFTFLAAVLAMNKVFILYCSTKRQDHPFCSHCVNRKCYHYALFVNFESSLDPAVEEEQHEEEYQPVHDAEEDDLTFNSHYMKKPPLYIRGQMYGYNFEDIIYPFSESAEQQEKWMERVGGLVNIPSRLEPLVEVGSKCKHNSLYDNRSEALVTESRTVCVFNDLGERIFKSEVLARPTLGPCNCLKRFDGNKLLIWHLGIPSKN